MGQRSLKIASVIAVMGAVFVFQMQPVISQDLDLERGRQYQADAIAAYGEGDLTEARRLMVEAAFYRPGHQGITYNLALLAAIAGDQAASIGYLSEIADMGLTTDLSNEAFAGFVGAPDFQGIEARLSDNGKPLMVAQDVVSTSVPVPLSEGIVWDEANGRYLISSVHDRAIYQMDMTGRVTPFSAEGSHGLLMGAMGMSVDQAHGLLWVATSALEQMKGYSAAADGMAGVFAFDLTTGEVRHRYMFPSTPGRNHVFGEVLVGHADDIFLSNSTGNHLFHLRPDGMVENIYELDNAASLQGMALSADESMLVVADYTTGLHLIDLSSGESRYLPAPPGGNLMGIDGLYSYKGDLIAIQNGVTPNRVLRIKMTPRWQDITAVEVLERNHPRFSEPTLGFVRGDAFYFIANSGWQEFANPENITDEMLSRLGPTHILSITLKD